MTKGKSGYVTSDDTLLSRYFNEPRMAWMNVVAATAASTGDVLVVDSSADTQVKMTGTEQHAPAMVVAMDEPDTLYSIANGTFGWLQYSGRCPRVNLNTAASRGNWLITSAASGMAEPVKTAEAPLGAFGYTLTEGSAPEALLFGPMTTPISGATAALFTLVCASPAASTTMGALIRAKEAKWDGDTLGGLLLFNSALYNQVGADLTANATWEDGSWVAPKQAHPSAVVAVIADGDGLPGEVAVYGRSAGSPTAITWAGDVKMTIGNPGARVTALGWKSVSDYTSVAAAVADLSSGDTLYFPPGEHALTSAVEINQKDVSVCGAGPGQTVLKFTGCDGIHIACAGTSTRCNIEDMTITTTNEGGYTALDLDGNNTLGTGERQFHVHNLEIRGSTAGSHYWDVGIDMYGGYNSVIGNCQIQGINTSATHMDIGLALHDASIDVQVSNLHTEFMRHGVYAGSARCEGIYLTNYIAVKVLYGVKWLNWESGAGAIRPLMDIYGGHISAVERGIDLDYNEHSSISGVTIYKNTATAATWEGIHLGANTRYVTVHGNVIDSTAGSEDGLGTGIFCDGDWCAITGNAVQMHASGAATACVVGTNSSKCSVSANIFDPATTSLSNGGGATINGDNVS